MTVGTWHWLATYMEYSSMRQETKGTISDAMERPVAHPVRRQARSLRCDCQCHESRSHQGRGGNACAQARAGQEDTCKLEAPRKGDRTDTHSTARWRGVPIAGAGTSASRSAATACHPHDQRRGHHQGSAYSCYVHGCRYTAGPRAPYSGTVPTREHEGLPWGKVGME